MSGYRIHIAAYVLSAIAATYLLPWFGHEADRMTLLISWAVGFFYCMLPDIDVPASKMREYVSKTLLAGTLLCLLAFAFLRRDITLVYVSIGIVIFLYLLWFTKHRGVFHTIYAGLLLSLPFYLINPLYGLYAVIGFFSHLLADGKLF